MRRALKKIIIIFIGFYLQTSMALSWTKIAPGIEYQDLNTQSLTNWSHIHVFRIDLKYNKLRIAMARDLNHEHAYASEFAEHTHALLAINGGFFDKKFNSLGLRISQHKQLNPLKYISWWGVFYIKDNTPHLSNVHDFNNTQNLDFAIQTGPRLLVKGHIPSLKPGFAERSALGITQDGRVIILATENLPMSTSWLAERMKASPLNCTDALNLDGGSSTQMYAHVDAFKINVPSFASVSDAIVVSAK